MAFCFHFSIQMPVMFPIFSPHRPGSKHACQATHDNVSTTFTSYCICIIVVLYGTCDDMYAINLLHATIMANRQTVSLLHVLMCSNDTSFNEHNYRPKKCMDVWPVVCWPRVFLNRNDTNISLIIIRAKSNLEATYYIGRALVQTPSIGEGNLHIFVITSPNKISHPMGAGYMW